MVQPTFESVPPEFLPIPIDETPSSDESIEVPPPADEPGLGETHDVEGLANEHYELAQPEPRMDGGMDIDMIDEKPETDLKELLAVMHRDEKDEIFEANAEILAIVKSLGGNQAGYRRERRKAIKAVVSEIDSPPRVTAATKLLPELRVMPGFAFELTTCDVDGRRWDFDEKVMRERALKRVKEEKPLLLIGSPCARRSPRGKELITSSETSTWLRPRRKER